MARRGPKPDYLTLVKAADSVGDPASEHCGGVTQAGTPCQRKAGWGTDHPGEGGCVDHPERRSAACPLPLKDLELQIWNDLVVQLRDLGLLRIAPWPSIYGLVVALAALHEADQAMDVVIIKGANSRNRKHPSIGAMNQMLSQVRSYCAELGLTPSALVKIGVDEDDGKSRMEELISGGR